MAGVIILLLIVASMVWVGYDAKKRDWTYKKHGSKTAAGQIIGVVLFWIIFFPVYLVQRRKAPLLVRACPARPSIGSPSQAATPITSTVAEQSARFKTCPDCAETVLADAGVCKHCHYRFDDATTSGEVA